MVVVSRQAYELTSTSDPRKKMILPRGILTDVPEDFQDHTFQYGVFAGTISVPETHTQKVAADNGEMSKPISRLTAKEAREELKRRGIEPPEKATKAELIAMLGSEADEDDEDNKPFNV